MEAAQCSEAEELRAQLSELKAAQLHVASWVEAMGAKMDLHSTVMETLGARIEGSSREQFLGAKAASTVEAQVASLHGEMIHLANDFKIRQELEFEMRELPIASLTVEIGLKIEKVVSAMRSKLRAAAAESAKAVGALEVQLGLIRGEVAHAGSRSAHAL